MARSTLASLAALAVALTILALPGARSPAADCQPGTIVTVAGVGLLGCSGDGGPATEASLSLPGSVAVAPDGSIYIADTLNQRVRKVDPKGIITSVGDPLESPSGLAVGPDETVYVTDGSGTRVYKIDVTGAMTVFAGDGWRDDHGRGRFAGDGGPATEASLCGAQGLAVAPDGSVYIATGCNNRIRRVTPDGIIATVVGDGKWGVAGDVGSPTQASIGTVHGVAVAADGSVFMTDSWHHRVWKVDPGGVISRVAGTGEKGFAGDAGPAREAMLHTPYGIAVGPDGALYIADARNQRIRKVDRTGIITTVAGDGATSRPGLGRFGGDGGPAAAASLNHPKGVALAADGSIYIADTHNHRIRRVCGVTR